LALQEGLNGIRKLFAPHTSLTAPTLDALPNFQPHRDDELACPIAKSIHSDMLAGMMGDQTLRKVEHVAVDSQPIESFRAPREAIEKRTAELKTRRDGDGFLWRETYDASGELMSAMIDYEAEACAVTKSQRSTLTAGLYDFVKRAVDAAPGESAEDVVEGLAEFAEKTDPKRAAEIRELGAELARENEAVEKLEAQLEEIRKAQ
jgi:hypothetical protein